MNFPTNLTRTMVPLALICLLICSSLVRAFPTISSSSSSQDFEHNDRLPRPMSLADGILADYMFQQADFDRNGRMSANEIAAFYVMRVHYSPYVARIYGETFIDLADTNNDGVLDRNELIMMLVAMDAVEWMKR